jgi:hypothetical protein
MTDTPTNEPNMHELINGWITRKYTSKHLNDELRKLPGEGTISERLQQNLNKHGERFVSATIRILPNSRSENQDDLSQQQPQEPPTPPALPPPPINFFVDTLQHAHKVFQDVLTNDATTGEFASILLNSGYDYTDPTGKMKKLGPENVKSILDDYESGKSPQSWEDVTGPAKFTLKDLIIPAWTAWMRAQIRKHQPTTLRAVE